MLPISSSSESTSCEPLRGIHGLAKRGPRAHWYRAGIWPSIFFIEDSCGPTSRNLFCRIPNSEYRHAIFNVERRFRREASSSELRNNLSQSPPGVLGYLLCCCINIILDHHCCSHDANMQI